MERRRHTISRHYVPLDTKQDDLVLRIRRIVLHRGFDRDEIASLVLKRFTPNRDHSGRFAEASMRQRLNGTHLDTNAIASLSRVAETALDSARLRHT